MKQLWHYFSHLGLEGISEEEILLNHRPTLLLNRMVFVVMTIMLLYLPAELYLNGFKLIAVIILDIVMIAMVWLFHYYRKLEAAKIYFMAIGLLLVGPIGLLVPHGAGNELFLIPASTIGVLLLRNNLFGVVYGVVCLLVLVAVIVGRNYISPLVDITPDLLKVFYPFFAGMTLIVVFSVVFYFRGINEKYQVYISRQKEQIAHSNEMLSEKNKEITHSINYAKKIQDAYLPPIDVFDRVHYQGFILFQPKDIVSGDFYWFYREGAAEGNPTDFLYLAVADCTGHGVPGALMSVVCCNALNDCVVSRKLSDPGVILDETRKQVVRNLKSERGSGRQDGMDISFCRINRVTGEMWFAGANNSAIIISADHTLTELRADKQPIGYFERATNFTTTATQLQKGDTLYLFSDGYADQFGGPKGKKFKYANLTKLLLDIHLLPLPEQKSKLNEALENWRGDLEQVDDICVIGVRF